MTTKNPDGPDPLPTDPLEKFLQELTSLVDLIKLGKKIPMNKIPPDIQERLDNLDEQADFLSKINEMMFKEAGVKPEQLKKKPSEIEGITPEMANLLKQSENLRKEVAVLEGEAVAELIIAKRLEKEKVKKEKTSMTKRRKKFRHLGDTGWQKL